MMFPKPKFKRRVQKSKNNKVPTISQRCMCCSSPYAQTHEVFEGSGRRQLSIQYKMQVCLCDRCHKQLHDNPLKGLDLELKRKFQMIFMGEYGEDFYMKKFMRSYV